MKAILTEYNTDESASWFHFDDNAYKKLTPDDRDPAVTFAYHCCRSKNDGYRAASSTSTVLSTHLSVFFYASVIAI